MYHQTLRSNITASLITQKLCSVNVVFLNSKEKLFLISDFSCFTLYCRQAYHYSWNSGKSWKIWLVTLMKLSSNWKDNGTRYVIILYMITTWHFCDNQISRFWKPGRYFATLIFAIIHLTFIDSCQYFLCILILICNTFFFAN